MLRGIFGNYLSKPIGFDQILHAKLPNQHCFKSYCTME